MNKADREARNQSILHDYQEGMDIYDMAVKYDLMPDSIRRVVVSMGGERKVHQQVKDRLNQGLEGIHEWAEENGIDFNKVRYRAKKMGLKLPRKLKGYRAPVKTSKVLCVAGKLVSGELSQSEIAKELGVHRQYVELVQRQCEAVGILK